MNALLNSSPSGVFMMSYSSCVTNARSGFPRQLCAWLTSTGKNCLGASLAMVAAAALEDAY